MTDTQFDQQIRAALDRVTALRLRSETEAGDGSTARAVLMEAVEELSLAFEELNVAQEELRVQNETLAAAEVMAVAERDRFRDLFEFASNGYLVTDAEGTVLESNRAARELLRTPGPRYLVGKPLAIFVAKDDKPALHGQLTALQKGESAWSRRLRFQPRGEGGEGPRTVDVTVVPFRDPGTRLPRLRWQLRDVTEQAEAADLLRRTNEVLEERVRERTAELKRSVRENEGLIEQLREQDRRKDEFLAVLAHELRNPLAPIRNAVQILQLVGSNDPTVVQARTMIDRQAIGLSRLVDDLLDVSRIARGKLHLSPEPTDLGEAARAAAEAVREAAKDRGVKVAVEPPAEAVVAVADPSRLGQVLTNLMTNAVKYTDRGGRVFVDVGREGGGGVVRVRDTGMGIAPEVLPHVFELFVQSDRTIDHAHGGLGIGLHLVKQLVDLHGGTVTAHSAGPGQGSEFVVSLPAV